MKFDFTDWTKRAQASIDEQEKLMHELQEARLQNENLMEGTIDVALVSVLFLNEDDPALVAGWGFKNGMIKAIYLLLREMKQMGLPITKILEKISGEK